LVLEIDSCFATVQTKYLCKCQQFLTDFPALTHETVTDTINYFCQVPIMGEHSCLALRSQHRLQKGA